MLELLLSCCPNPDIQENRGYWSPGKRPRPTWVDVKSLAEAKERCVNFIVSNDLGGGNFSGGAIKHNGIVIARVSYNGKVWDEGTDSKVEITDPDELNRTDW